MKKLKKLMICFFTVAMMLCSIPGINVILAEDEPISEVTVSETSEPVETGDPVEEEDDVNPSAPVLSGFYLKPSLKETEDFEHIHLSLLVYVDYSSLNDEDQNGKKVVVTLPDGLLFEKNELENVTYLSDQQAEITVSDENKSLECSLDITEDDRLLLTEIADDEEGLSADIQMDVYAKGEKVESDREHSFIYTFTAESVTALFTPLVALLANGVTVNSGAPTQVDMGTVTGDIVIKADGLYVGGTHVDTALNPDGYEFSGTTTTHNIIVQRGVTTTLILNNVDITSYKQSNGSTSGSCIDVSGANVTMVLNGTNRLIYDVGPDDDYSVNKGCALEKSGFDGSLTIQTVDGTNNHSLHAEGIKFHNGAIGSGLYSVVRTPHGGFTNFTIKSGTISAKGGQHSPGIGANCLAWGAHAIDGHYNNSHHQYTKDIHIEGGVITAYGGNGCAGLGSGQGVPVDGIYISGGAVVTAYGGRYSPGIGSGGIDSLGAITADNQNQNYANLNVSHIVITGGGTRVTAYGDQDSNMPGIGCGLNRHNFTAGLLENVSAVPEEYYQGYVKYGSGPTSYAYSTANPKTPFPTEEEFGSYLQGECVAGNPVFYTQVYFGPYKDNNALDNNTEIGANDAIMKTGGSPLNAAGLKNVARVSGHDEAGNPIDTDSIIPNQTQIDAINAAKTAGKVGDFPLEYTLTYTDPNSGQQKTLTLNTTVSLREEGTDSSEPMPAIGADDAIHKTGGAAWSDDDLLQLCDVNANDSQGRNAVIRKEDGSIGVNRGVSIDSTQKQALNDAKTAGLTGSYPLTFRYTDPITQQEKTAVVNVELREYGTDDVNPGDPENGANGTIHQADGSVFTKADLVNATEPIAKDKDGNDIPANNIIMNEDDFTAINAARTGKKEGKFPLRYSYLDNDGTKVEFTTYVTLWNDTEPVVDANNKTIHSDTAKTVTSKDDLAAFLNPSVTDKNGNPATPSSIDVSASDMAAIQAGTPGAYPVTYTYNYTYYDNNGVLQNGTKSKTVNLTVVQTPTITANSATITSTTAIASINDSSDLAAYLNPSVVGQNGETTTPSSVTVDPNDMTKIKNGVEGTYPVTYNYVYTDNTGATPTQRTVSTTVNLIITNAASITATDKTISDTHAKTLTDVSELKTLMNVEAKDDAGNNIDLTQVTATVSDENWTKIKNGTPGTYSITFTYTDTTGKTVTVSKLLTVQNTPEITATEKSIYAGYAIDHITDKEDLIDIMNPSATDTSGQMVEVSGVTVDDADFAAIQAGTLGTYAITFSYTYTDHTGDTPVDRVITKMVLLTLTSVLVDPPVQKRVIGDLPSSQRTFNFVLTPLDQLYPMPEGSVNGTKTVSITGNGSVELGEMEFIRPGTYQYTVSEVIEQVSGYTYDTTQYDLIVTVAEKNLALTATVQFFIGNDEVRSILFTNRFQNPPAPYVVPDTSAH